MMIIKLAFIDYAALGALGFMHGSNTPEMHKTKKEMSYAGGALRGAVAYGAIPAIQGAVGGALVHHANPGLPNSRKLKGKAASALAGAALFGLPYALYGAGAGTSAIIGTRLGRKAAQTNEDSKSFKKMK